jgi:hypothetical protein
MTIPHLDFGPQEGGPDGAGIDAKTFSNSDQRPTWNVESSSLGDLFREQRRVVASDFRSADVLQEGVSVDSIASS